ncbi:MAG TPA: hypothetical protein VMW69_14165, partial [Spirochaetia bacterium]|nr:hypothetical protein [Spirochaetia bacterium]
TFWLNASGLEMLYTSLAEWTAAALSSLEAHGFFAVIAVGFTRFGSYIAARSRRKSIVFTSEAQEEQTMRRAPLRGLPLAPPVLELLHRLGVETVGDFLDLPAEGVAKRFGREAREIFRWAHRERLPIQPIALDRNASITRRLDDPVGNFILLTAYVDELLDELMGMVVAKQRLVASVTLELYEGDEERGREQIQPAVPTGEASVLKALSRLRISEQSYEGLIDRIEVCAEEILPIHRDGELFASVRHQAREAGKRAVALIRARFGNDAVRHAVLRDEHLPEKRYAWEAVTEPLFPNHREGSLTGEMEPEVQAAGRSSPGASGAALKAVSAQSSRTLRVVRRLFEGSPPAGPAPGSVRLIAGPFIYTGKWWQSEERREYYFARSGHGGLLWIYRDEQTEGWTVQGLVD